MLSFVAIALIAIVWLLRRSQNPHPPIPTEAVERDATLTPTAQVSATNAPSRSQKSPSETPEEYTQQFHERVMADRDFEWKHPIDFWGRVLDEADQPLEGATIEFTWNDVSQEGSSHSVATSDRDGRFSLLDRRGKRLYVKVWREGYYSTSQALTAAFEYANPFDNRFIPDARNPVVFRMRKIAALEPLETRQVKLDLPNNAGPLGFNPVTHKLHSEGPLLLELQASPRDEQKRSDYRLTMVIRGGGLIATNEEFPFTAPEAGYEPSHVWMMEREDPNWMADLSGQFYFYLSDPRLYGRGRFELLLSNGRADSSSVLILTYWLNPSGSRNLEADPSKYIQRTPPYLLR